MKIIIVGDSNVGKTSLMVRYCDDDFSPQLMNISVDYKEKMVSSQAHGEMKCTIWDTAGQERYRTITSSFYRDADVVILVYDIADESSFMNLDKWHSEVESFLPNACKILVANKSDLNDERVIKEDQGNEWALNHGYLFEECSAKTAHNVEHTFERILDTNLEHNRKSKGKPKKQLISIKKPEKEKEKEKRKFCVI